MRLNSKAQSMIEYSTMATLVLVGILIMGPYVVRSINAFFQSLDDDVHDSITENITQTPQTNFGIPSACQCTGLQDVMCGGGGCNNLQMFRQNTCTPAGCENDLISRGIPVIMSECAYRNTCCSPWVATGNCGVNAAPPAGHMAGGCPDGEMEYTRNCGDPAQVPPIVQYVCQSTCAAGGGCAAPPTPACVFTCVDALGNVVNSPVARANWCPGANTALSSDTLISLVCGAGSCTAAKCQMYCNSPFAVVGTPPNTWCECLQWPGAQYNAGTNTCVCVPPFWTESPPSPAQLCALPSPMPGGVLTCQDVYTGMYAWMIYHENVTCPGNIRSGPVSGNGGGDTCNGDTTNQYICP